MLVLSGCSCNPSAASTSAARRRACFGPFLGWGTGRRSRRRSCTSTPQRRPASLPRLVEDVQGDVGQQRGDRRALRGSRLRVGDHPTLEHPGPQPTPQQLQHPPVRHPPLPPGPSGRHGRSASKHALMSASSTHSRPRLAVDPDGLEGLMGRPLRAEPETDRQEVGLEDRLEHDLRCRHHHPVRARRECRAAGSAPGLPGLGICTRRNGCGRYVPDRNCRGELIEEGSHRPDAPGLDDRRCSRRRPQGRPGWRPRRTHALHITSLRATLS